MTGLLNPKSSEKGKFVLHDCRSVPRPWDFSSGSSFILLLINFWGGTCFELSNWETLRKKVLHLYRSTRFFFWCGEKFVEKVQRTFSTLTRELIFQQRASCRVVR